MTHSPIPRSGGAILADALIANGAHTVFCVPGESYLPFLDAAADRRDSLRVVTCRHEAAQPTWPRPSANSRGGRGCAS